MTSDQSPVLRSVRFAALGAVVAASAAGAQQVGTGTPPRPASRVIVPQPAAPDAPAKRPVLKADRWMEDWSPLADDQLRVRPFDRLKYLPIGGTNPASYLSLGLTSRQRFERTSGLLFGIGGQRGDSYLLNRTQLHLDARLGTHWQLFTQLEDVRAPGKRRPLAPTDENRLDARLAFLGYAAPLGGGTIRARAGRQDFAFDLQRFVSSREGPNVRQSFDALWADYEVGRWRVSGFVSQPVQYRSDRAFDDRSDRHFRFHAVRAERRVLGHSELSAYYARFEKDDAYVLRAVGDERRDVVDVRFAGGSSGLDWDLEGMLQRGRVGATSVQAWAVGTRLGYTLPRMGVAPRLGLQFDMASGDRGGTAGRLETFNPLFPNARYFSLAGYTGYSNLLHLKPSLGLRPSGAVALTGAVGLQWRQTTADAIYAQPDVPLPRTAGQPGRWSGAYWQERGDWKISDALSLAIEAVQYDAGAAIRRAGGHDSTYLGTELKFQW